MQQWPLMLTESWLLSILEAAKYIRGGGLISQVSDVTAEVMRSTSYIPIEVALCNQAWPVWIPKRVIFHIEVALCNSCWVPKRVIS